MAMKVLVADDSPTIRRRAAATLGEAGYEVTCVEDGQAAWSQLEGGMLPDLVLCDILMPQLDGYELCRRIKADTRLAQVPVMLLRGTFEPWDEQRAMDVGADGYVTKPFEPEALLSTIRELLPSGPGGAEPVAAAPPPAPEPAATTPAVSMAMPDASSMDVPFGEEPLGEVPAAPMAEESPIDVEAPLSLEEDVLEAPPAPVAAAPLEADPFGSGDEPFGSMAPEPLPPPPAPAPVMAPAVVAPPVVAAGAPMAAMDDAAMSELVERVLRRMTADQVEKIVWEVVPDVAEALIRKRILEIEAKISGS